MLAFITEMTQITTRGKQLPFQIVIFMASTNYFSKALMPGQSSLSLYRALIEKVA